MQVGMSCIVLVIVLENATALGERRRVLHRQFCISQFHLSRLHLCVAC